MSQNVDYLISISNPAVFSLDDGQLTRLAGLNCLVIAGSRAAEEVS